MSKGLTIDDETGFVDLVGLARDMSAQSPKSVVLPTKPARKGGAAVLVLDQPEADAVLATFAS